MCRKQGCEAFRVGGTENHVHIACSLPRTTNASDLIKTIKLGSSKWLNSGNRIRTHFYWQTGFGVFSVGYSQLGSLLKYIDNQEQHHANNSFETELLSLLKHYDVTYDEKYLWD